MYHKRPWNQSIQLIVSIKKKLRTFNWEAGTVVEDMRQSKKKEQKRGFLIFLHLSCHQFCFLKDLKLLGWLVSKAVWLREVLFLLQGVTHCFLLLILCRWKDTTVDKNQWDDTSCIILCFFILCCFYFCSHRARSSWQIGMDGKHMFPPIFWDDRSVPTNIWANVFTLTLEWTHIR